MSYVPYVTRDKQTFSVKDLNVDTLDFANYTVSVTTQFCYYIKKASINNM